MNLLLILADYSPGDAGAEVLNVIGIGALLFMVIALAVRSGTRRPAQDNRPGRFRVRGVAVQTRQDVEWVCDAASPDNARAKGELEGIRVTAVQRLG